MSWNLEIHHIDLISRGDATFLIAWRAANGENPPLVRTMLIDGGEQGASPLVDNFIKNKLIQRFGNVHGGLGLDVMVATHYDADHVGGLTASLSNADEIYGNTVIFDQGAPGRASSYTKRGELPRDPVRYGIQFESPDQAFGPFEKAVGERTRVTHRVVSNYTQRPSDEDFDRAGWMKPWWLLGKELLWYNPNRIDQLPPPPGAPKVTCIAVNECVRQIKDGREIEHKYLPSSETIDFAKNSKSLALLVEFNNFKYYLGGDIEGKQEDGDQGICGNIAPVHAMKASHHGSAKSTSELFLNKMMPSAVFISCGTNNGYWHPDCDLVYRLEQNQFVNEFYLTGRREYIYNEIRRFYPKLTRKGIVTGNGNGNGHVSLYIDEGQSRLEKVIFKVGFYSESINEYIFTCPGDIFDEMIPDDIG